MHLNERDAALRSFIENRTPCVVAETDQGLVMVVDDAALTACDGSPACLVDAISTNLSAIGLHLG